MSKLQASRWQQLANHYTDDDMRANGQRARSGKESHAVTLCDLGVTGKQSSRWQQIAR